MKISAVYRIINTVTGDFYIGSSKNVKHRLANHKCPSTWNECPNNPMYIDMKQYGLDKFEFQIIAEVEAEKLKEAEQHYIETLKPTYNNRRADGFDFERRKKYNKDYQKEYQKTEKGKETHRKASKEYYNQLCCYNGETLTLSALSQRFKSQGIPNPVIEAKKYIIQQQRKGISNPTIEAKKYLIER